MLCHLQLSPIRSNADTLQIRMQNLCDFSKTFSACNELFTALAYFLLPREVVIYVKVSCILEEAKMELYYHRRSLSKSLHKFASDAAMDSFSRAASSCNQLGTYFLQNSLGSISLLHQPSRHHGSPAHGHGLLMKHLAASPALLTSNRTHFIKCTSNGVSLLPQTFHGCPLHPE